MIKRNFGIRKSDIINRRMFIIGAAKIVIFGGLVARLFVTKRAGTGSRGAHVLLFPNRDVVGQFAVG